MTEFDEGQYLHLQILSVVGEQIITGTYNVNSLFYKPLSKDSRISLV